MRCMRCCLLGVLAAVAAFSQVDGPIGGVPVADEPPGGLKPAQPPPLSPPAKTSITINGRKITIKYGAPSMRKRGLEYHQERDLGRVPMDLSRSPKPIETYKITLTKTAVTDAQLKLAWENTVATVSFVVRVAP